jgi:hypothetical protein
MPTSDPYNISPLMSVVINLKPKSILDIGCGFGKYGVLFREYLDIWDERYLKDQWQCRIVGVEAFAEYRNPIWDYVYQDVIVGRAQEAVPPLPGPFDLVLISDMIEHLEMAEAKSLVQCCLDKCSVLIVTTPREFYAQHNILGNEYERHRCLWTAAEFPAGAHVLTVRALACDMFLATKQPLDRKRFIPAELADYVYLRSRNKLRRAGVLGWPVSATLRTLSRWFT